MIGSQKFIGVEYFAQTKDVRIIFTFLKAPKIRNDVLISKSHDNTGLEETGN